ncbi:hypothetical protein JAAARDRAFT_190697 [Jaapia argillacea MUCL 33604]|uniref:Uncharacterized protein n=1 Tax=Jaapia argillacea MUCL 33604 TaxID=933084 RepID=A0A067Q4L8_9AGAM|nr:hypothetical protein JAAARDRAFT_190697 [Jaapia argillacea MUCL 33604]
MDTPTTPPSPTPSYHRERFIPRPTSGNFRLNYGDIAAVEASVQDALFNAQFGSLRRSVDVDDFSTYQGWNRPSKELPCRPCVVGSEFEDDRTQNGKLIEWRPFVYLMTTFSRLQSLEDLEWRKAHWAVPIVTWNPSHAPDPDNRIATTPPWTECPNQWVVAYPVTVYGSELGFWRGKRGKYCVRYRQMRRLEGLAKIKFNEWPSVHKEGMERERREAEATALQPPQYVADINEARRIRAERKASRPQLLRNAQSTVFQLGGWAETEEIQFDEKAQGIIGVASPSRGPPSLVAPVSLAASKATTSAVMGSFVWSYSPPGNLPVAPERLPPASSGKAWTWNPVSNVYSLLRRTTRKLQS